MFLFQVNYHEIQFYERYIAVHNYRIAHYGYNENFLITSAVDFLSKILKIIILH